MLQQSTHYHVSERYLKDGGPKHVEKALEVYPYASVSLQILLILRMLLFLLSIKWRNVTRLAMFLEISIYIAESFLPVDVGWMDFHSSSRLIAVTIQFILCYFYWWPTLVYSLIALGIWHYNRWIFYEEESMTVGHLIGVTVWFSVNIFLIHLVITWVGRVLTESDVLKDGNVNILDNLEEGVVILKDDDSRKILYYNISASGSKRSQWADVQSNVSLTQLTSKPNLAIMLQENSLKQFAPIEKSIFAATTADTLTAVQMIQDSDDYVSIRQIVDEDHRLD